MKPRQAFELTMAVSPADHTLGPPHAPVTVVEYGDFECPNCKQASPVVKLALESVPESEYSSSIAISRWRKSILMRSTRQRRRKVLPGKANSGPCMICYSTSQPHLKLNQLSNYAERLQLDMAHYTADMKEHTYLQRIREHEQSGRESGVRSTPTFFINRRLHDVSFGLVDSRKRSRQPCACLLGQGGR